MQISISLAAIDDKSIIQRMMELYQYDFSEYEENDLDSHGFFGYPYLDHYWNEPERYPLLIRIDQRLAGFVLINQHTLIADNRWSIAEFFIMRKYRGKGIGRIIAFAIFDKFPGSWEVSETTNNVIAQKFWRKIINEYTQENYREEILNNDQWQGPVQYFDNRKFISKDWLGQGISLAMIGFD